MFALPSIQIGNPTRHQSLSIFPLFSEQNGQIDYLLSDEAIQAGLVSVEEVSEAGSVPELLVTNRGDRRVLFIEGEELVGAKQNRVLNTSVLIAANSQTKIPVSCVERGRWRSKSKQFGSGGTHSPSALRHSLKASVSHSLKSGHGYRSDQGRVWAEVSKKQTSLGVTSHTDAMSDSFDAYQDQIVKVLEGLPVPDQAIGLAVGVGNRVVAFDLFDKPATLRKVWKRLLTGFILDSFEHQEAATVEQAAAERFVEKLRGSTWQQSKSVGEGEDYRSDTDGDFVSALAVDGALIHGSALAEV